MASGKDDPVTAKGDAQLQVGGFNAGELLMALGSGTPERFGDVNKPVQMALMAATTLSTAPAPGTGNGGGGGRRGGGGGLGMGAPTAMPGNGVIRVKIMVIDAH
jgi:hypothetical protein